MRIDLTRSDASRFFAQELPRRGIFLEMESAGLQVVDYGCEPMGLHYDDGTIISTYHRYFIVFASDEQAVQFKLTHLCA